MLTLPIGEMDLELETIGAGVRNGILPPPDVAWDLTPRQMNDLAAFELEGWEFQRGLDLNWANVPPRVHGEPVEAGLLAIHPSKSLVIVKFEMVIPLPPGASKAPLERSYPAVRRLPFGENLYWVRLAPTSEDLQRLITGELASWRSKVFAETRPDPVLAYNVKPVRNLKTVDPVPQWQWGPIQLESAWKAGTYGKQVRVAIIDCGFHRKDPQIQGNVEWWARLKPDGKWVYNDTMTEDPHGTFCAGLVGGILDGKAVSGVAPECQLILVAVKPTGVVDQVELGEAVTICAKGDGGTPADVISCSLGLEGSWEKSTALRSAIDDAMQKGRKALGVPIVWADFNVSKPIEPNSLEDYDPLLLVAQSNSDDVRVSSGYGSGLDLMAPGDNVVGLDWSGNASKVGQGSGCSYAAPIVAGVAALVLAVRPDLTADQVSHILTRSCDPQVNVKAHANDVGWGRLNALEAMNKAKAFKGP